MIYLILAFAVGYMIRGRLYTRRFDRAFVELSSMVREARHGR